MELAYLKDILLVFFLVVNKLIKNKMQNVFV